MHQAIINSILIKRFKCLLLILFYCCSCNSSSTYNDTTKTEKSVKDSMPLKSKPDYSDTSKFSNGYFLRINKFNVTDFFYMLQVDDEKPVNGVSHKQYILTTIGKTGKDWIKNKDVEFLMQFIESKERSNCVMQAISSQMNFTDTSTVGGQVMNLIDAYRFKKEYPYFLTDCANTDEKRVVGIKLWWNKHQLEN